MTCMTSKTATIFLRRFSFGILTVTCTQGFLSEPWIIFIFLAIASRNSLLSKFTSSVPLSKCMIVKVTEGWSLKIRKLSASRQPWTPLWPQLETEHDMIDAMTNPFVLTIRNTLHVDQVNLHSLPKCTENGPSGWVDCNSVQPDLLGMFREFLTNILSTSSQYPGLLQFGVS